MDEILAKITPPDLTAVKRATADPFVLAYQKGYDDAGGNVNIPPHLTTREQKLAWLQSEAKRREREFSPLIKERKELDQCLRTWKCTQDAKIIKRELDIAKLRKRIKWLSTAPAKSLRMESEDIRRKTRELASVMWFDFSACDMNEASDVREAIELGKEMVAHGILRLPYDRCMFLTTTGTEHGMSTEARFLEQKTAKEIVTRHVAAYGHAVNRWFGMFDCDNALQDYDVLCLLSLCSKATDVEEVSFAGKPMQMRNAPPSVSYRRVVLSKQVRAMEGTGTHASPRLHWRRGHQRILRSGRITWVRPTLVGDANRGLVVHDYQMAADAGLREAAE